MVKGVKLGSNIVILLICMAAGIGAMAWMKFFNIKQEKTAVTTKHQGSYASKIIPPIPTPYNYIAPTPFPDKYGLVSQQDWQIESDYRNVGSVQEGQLKGYSLVLAIVDPDGPGEALTYLLATADYKTFYLHGDSAWINSLADDDTESPYNFLKKEKIAGVVDLLSQEFPETIALNNNYALYRGEPSYRYDAGRKKFLYGESFVDANPLPSPISNLKLFAHSWYSYGGAAKFIKESTGVTIVNDSGLAVEYELATVADIERYKEELPAYRASYLQTAKNDKWNDFKFISPPSLRLSGSDIPFTGSLYEHYDEAIPGGCGRTVSTKVIRNVSDSELVSLGWKNDREYFKLVDDNHPLLKAQYNAKFFEDDPEKPSYVDYLKKLPLVFFKDNWGRLIALGEYDYILPGGCGKPVVYLYPPKETVVHLEFLKPMRLDVQIPTYKNGWNVLARPNGVLTDLQPEATNCSLFDGITHGQEYAKKACETRTYPYIYWAGRSLSGAYLKPASGFIVKQNDVAKFLDEKMAIVGLNSAERRDMAEYWVPVLMAKNAPYYRLSFLQTPELNELAPMKVTPKPDTTIRIFLDWETLESQPTIPIPSQNLTTYSRDGFTLVEWGGLKK